METKHKVVPQRKLDYGEKLKGLLNEYPKCLIVTVDNVGSKQISEFRKDLRGRGRFLFGKNTMIRKVIRNYIKESGNKQMQSLLDLVKGNSGFLFTREDVAALRKEIISRKVQSAAKAGSVAPSDVMVPPGPTGMEPTQTSFFQAMNISTRINRGQIDIVNEVKLISAGEKVGASEASLLTKLGIKPFYYGMGVTSIYDDGAAYSADILDITDDDLANAFFQGLRNIAAISMTLQYPTIPQVPHSVINAYKQMLSLGLEFKSYSWENLDLVKEILENPDAFMAAAPAANAGGGGAAAPEPEPEESSSKESSGGGPGLFGGDSDSDDSSDDDSD